MFRKHETSSLKGSVFAVDVLIAISRYDSSFSIVMVDVVWSRMSSDPSTKWRKKSPLSRKKKCLIDSSLLISWYSPKTKSKS